MWLYEDAQLNEETGEGPYVYMAMRGIGLDKGFYICYWENNPEDLPGVYIPQIRTSSFRYVQLKDGTSKNYQYTNFYYNGASVYSKTDAQGGMNYLFKSYNGEWAMNSHPQFDETMYIDTDYGTSSIWDERIQSGTKLTDVIDLVRYVPDTLTSNSAALPQNGGTIEFQPWPGQSGSATVLSGYRPVWSQVGGHSQIYAGSASSKALSALSSFLGTYRSPGQKDKIVGDCVWEDAVDGEIQQRVYANANGDGIEQTIVVYKKGLVDFEAFYYQQDGSWHIRRGVGILNLVVNLTPGSNAYVSFDYNGSHYVVNPSFAGFTIGPVPVSRKQLVFTDSPWYRETSLPEH